MPLQGQDAAALRQVASAAHPPPAAAARRHGARTPLTDKTHLWAGQVWDVCGEAYKASASPLQARRRRRPRGPHAAPPRRRRALGSRLTAAARRACRPCRSTSAAPPGPAGRPAARTTSRCGAALGALPWGRCAGGAALGARARGRAARARARAPGAARGAPAGTAARKAPAPLQPLALGRPPLPPQVAIKLPGGCHKGQLTLVGQQQALDLGRWLRSRYVDQLGFMPGQHEVGAGGPAGCRRPPRGQRPQRLPRCTAAPFPAAAVCRPLPGATAPPPHGPAAAASPPARSFVPPHTHTRTHRAPHHTTPPRRSRAPCRSAPPTSSAPSPRCAAWSPGCTPSSSSPCRPRPPGWWMRSSSRVGRLPLCARLSLHALLTRRRQARCQRQRLVVAGAGHGSGDGC
jgi:hypothetical protein